MDSASIDSSPQPGAQPSYVELPAPASKGQSSSASELTSVSSASSTSSGAKSSELPQLIASEGKKTGAAGLSTFSRLTSGLRWHFPSKPSGAEEVIEITSDSAEAGIFESLKKGLFESSKSAVNAVQLKARHIVSQNKRRYQVRSPFYLLEEIIHVIPDRNQEGGFDLDMTYITDNIIAMGFPAGDLSSGIFGFLEGFYRNHMEEVIKFFETHHKGKYKVYNLCSERLYDASLFEGKVASFPFDDHNCPPLQLLTSFCRSAHSWLKEDIQNVIVVHCKAGMGRTGLMICSLLLFLKIFPTAEEAIDYFNNKRCVDGKALVLPSQIRYVRYFECILTQFKGENQPGRRCMLRGFRLHMCPYWIRPSITISNHTGVLFSTKKHPKTKDLMPEDFWIRAPKKGIVVFAIPGEPGLTELVGDFKIHFHDRQGDFYCWLNTTMTENRITLVGSDFDGFEKRNLPSPGFQVEIVMIDYDGTRPTTSKSDSSGNVSNTRSSYVPAQSGRIGANSSQKKVFAEDDNDDVFSDSDGEESGASEGRKTRAASEVTADQPHHVPNARDEKLGSLTHGTEQLSLGREELSKHKASEEVTSNRIAKHGSGLDMPNLGSVGASDIKAIAADASVFSFGDDEDYESE